MGKARLRKADDTDTCFILEGGPIMVGDLIELMENINKFHRGDVWVAVEAGNATYAVLELGAAEPFLFIGT